MMVEDSHQKVLISLDATDHVDFFCGHCSSKMRVKRVSTRKLYLRNRDDVQDRVTRITVTCLKCGHEASRKFYWDSPFKPRKRSGHNDSFSA